MSNTRGSEQEHSIIQTEYERYRRNLFRPKRVYIIMCYLSTFVTLLFTFLNAQGVIIN